MGIMHQHLGNALQTSILQQHMNLWKSPRGTVLRIEVLAIMAIVFAFFVIAFGSCRRWSDRWIIQKGFLIANALSLSLGSYSIGLMQSSPVKSKMYPVWAVSLLTLFGCVDSAAVFNGIDYKSPLSKMIFQLCLYFGYVVLLSISTISTDVGNLAISVLSSITFIKGFHRSLSLVMPKRMRDLLNQQLLQGQDGLEKFVIADPDFSDHKDSIVDFPTNTIEDRFNDDGKTGIKVDGGEVITMDDIISLEKDDLPSFRDECFAFSLSHMLQRNFLGLSHKDNDLIVYESYTEKRKHYEWTLKVVEVELAFLYETFFTSNSFLHYYEAKTYCLWAFASFIGICFVGTVVVIPGTLTRHQTTSGPGTDTIIVDTTTADLIVTLIILVSLALLQLVQLIRCWMSNWARVAFTCERVRYWRNKMRKQVEDEEAGRPSPNIAQEPTTASNQKKGISRQIIWLWWMRLKVFIVSRTNWLDKYLWQNKLGQYSLVVAQESCWRQCGLFSNIVRFMGAHLQPKCSGLVRMLGVRYIGEVLWDLWGSDSNKGSAIRLEDNVKASITDFLDDIVGVPVSCATINECWTSVLFENGLELESLPYIVDSDFGYYGFMERVTKWHIATCYCELREQKQEEHTVCNRRKGEREKNRLVANALSNYVVYLMGSAPELLPGRTKDAKYWYNATASGARKVLQGAKDMLEQMQKGPQHPHDENGTGTEVFWEGVALGKSLLDNPRCSDPWKVLALLWVQTLVYTAPYGEVEAHKQHLAKGGEFITHIWALLYHSGIFEWNQPEKEWVRGREWQWQTPHVWTTNQHEKSFEDKGQISEKEEDETEYGGQTKKEERSSEDKSKRRIIHVKRKPRPPPQS